MGLKFWAPELIVFLTGCVILFFDLVLKRKRREILLILSMTGLIFSIFFSVQLIGTDESLFFDMMRVDSYSIFFNIFFCASCGLVILISWEYIKLPIAYFGEYVVILLFATLGMLFLSKATDFLFIYVALELVSISCYALVGITKREPKSGEAAIKYLLLGAVATGTMLFGISYLYGVCGTTNIFNIASLLNSKFHPPIVIGGLNHKSLVVMSSLFILAGFGFKIAMVPFHMWCPDTYEGAPTPITAFLSVGPKAAGFAILLRVFLEAFTSVRTDWEIIVSVISLVTMTLGNLIALYQTNIKRMLAYSSIAQAGYILIGFVVPTEAGMGLSGVLIYLLSYLFMNLGAFAVVILISNRLGSDEIKDYAGLAQNSPAISLSLLIFLWSLAGLPPTGGFIGKFFVFGAAINSGYGWLALAGVLNSVISIFYYFNVVREMYISKEKSVSLNIGVERDSKFINSVLLVSVFFTLILGIYPEPFIKIVNNACSGFGP